MVCTLCMHCMCSTAGVSMAAAERARMDRLSRSMILGVGGAERAEHEQSAQYTYIYGASDAGTLVKFEILALHTHILRKEL